MWSRLWSEHKVEGIVPVRLFVPIFLATRKVRDRVSGYEDGVKFTERSRALLHVEALIVSLY